ncbi:hypothetical protein HDU97_001896 [Phlyctochytrium planicorne]|nr:hypothetical protein HDU97_001896 [Phlyctochytrium planicorne]
MVSLNAILGITTASITATTVQALATPKEPVNNSTALTYPTPATSSNWTWGSQFEPLTMLMQCIIYSSDGQPKDYFSDIGLYESVAASKDGSFPSAFLGPMVFPDWTDFSTTQTFTLRDTRKVYPNMLPRNLDKRFGESTGGVTVSYPDNRENGMFYQCYRDNNRDVFTAHFGDDYSICRAIHYCEILRPTY